MEKEVLHKELDLIQAVITRMANNSFLLKGWLVSLLAVILALSKDSIFGVNNSSVNGLLLIMLFPIFIFWYLDAFFLQAERRYRKLYSWVIANRDKSNEFMYDLNHLRFKKDVPTILGVMLSQTLFVFYLIPIVFIIAIYFVNK